MSSRSGESVMDVLARMKSELSFDVDELVQTGDLTAKSTSAPASPASVTPQVMATAPVLKSPPSTPVATANPPLVATPTTGAGDAADAAEDLNSYMGDLLNRYGKGGVAATAAAAADAAAEAADAFPKSALPQRKPRVATPEAAATAESGELQGAAMDDDDVESLPPELCLLEQQEFKPRKRAPEEKACIDAMRELAVHSARRALQTFDNKRRGLDAKHRLGLAFAAFTTSGVAFTFADEMFSLLGLVAMCGVATGSMFVVNWQQTIALLKKSTGN